MVSNREYKCELTASDLAKRTDRELLCTLWIAAHGLELRRHFSDSHEIVRDLRQRLHLIEQELIVRKIIP